MYAQKHPGLKLIFVILFGMLLAGCATDVSKSIKVSDDQMVKYDTLSAPEAIAALEKRINEAKSANLPFFAPNYFRSASEILADARKSSEKKPKNELIGEIAKADAILDKGQTMMTIVQSRLANVLAMKDQMDKDNVNKVYPKEYEESISELSSLIEKVELEKADDIDKDKIELIQMMQALDIRAIQYTALHESDVINEDTQSKDGEKLAPVTLAEALRVYQDAMSLIAQTPHDEALVQRAGADALFTARHARYVSERAGLLNKEVKESVEAIVLGEEKLLLDVSTALNHRDTRDQSIEKQAEEIARAAAEVLQKQQKFEQATGTANEQNMAFESRLRALEEAMKQANAELAEKDAQLSEKNAQLSEKITLISEKDVQLEALNTQAKQLEEQNQALSSSLAEKTKAPKVKK